MEITALLAIIALVLAYKISSAVKIAKEDSQTKIDREYLSQLLDSMERAGIANIYHLDIDFANLREEVWNGSSEVICLLLKRLLSTLEENIRGYFTSTEEVTLKQNLEKYVQKFSKRYSLEK